jgi:hypothetical protein
VRLTAQRCRSARHTSLHLSASRPTNTSRAYWELKAEQVMDRVFDNAGRSAPVSLQTPPTPPPPPSEEPIDVEVRDTSRHWTRSWHQTFPRPWQIATGAIACLTLIGGFSLWRGWSEARNDLRQERNLRLLEGIRSLGTGPDGTANSDATPNLAGDTLPPPPPGEPWIEELGQLEARSPTAPCRLQRLRRPPPPCHWRQLQAPHLNCWGLCRSQASPAQRSSKWAGAPPTPSWVKPSAAAAGGWCPPAATAR